MKHLFAKEAEPAAPDELTTAKESVAKLAAALATAENESTETRTAYDREMRDFIANGKVEPSLEGQRVAAEKCDSLRRLLSEAREHLARVASEAEAAKRHDAIRASGSRVAELTTTAEAKLATFQSAVNAVRVAEAELFSALFDQQVGLKQRFGIAQKDADFARHRLRRQAIQIAEESTCRINARFETDGQIHLGEPCLAV